MDSAAAHKFPSRFGWLNDGLRGAPMPCALQQIALQIRPLL